MENEEILLEEFCTYHEVEVSFIRDLGDSGLIQVSRVEESTFIPVDEMPKAERFIRMHYDLNINLEGLETIDHLLHKMESLQQEVRRLQNRL